MNYLSQAYRRVAAIILCFAPLSLFAQLQVGIQAGTPPVINVTGAPGIPCQVQWSETIAGTGLWRHLGSTVLSASPAAFPDNSWQGSSARFYRAIQTPAANMVLIPEGTFLMGDFLEDSIIDTNNPISDELPTNTVFISSFFIGQFEVTNDEMREVMQWAFDNALITASSTGVTNLDGDAQELLNFDGSTPSAISFAGGTFSVEAGQSSYPCLWVTWYGAAAYCNYRSNLEGKTPCYDLSDWSCDFAANGYRLPTEGEWEKAARGGLEGGRYPWGNSLNPGLVNYKSGFDPGNPTPVGSYPPNGYGLYDAVGNAYEWCSDWYQGNYYTVIPATDPRGPTSGSERSARGGSFATSCVSLPTCPIRVADRERTDPGNSFFDTGFRVVLPAGTPIAPTLSVVAAEPQQVLISWAPQSQGWTLQEKSSLTSNWVDSPSGSKNPVSIRVTGPPKFYRLRKL
jgi:formylglycine-generating enzyme required for sulfatase activity